MAKRKKSAFGQLSSDQTNRKQRRDLGSAEAQRVSGECISAGRRRG
jgi:hypothetical protein